MGEVSRGCVREIAWKWVVFLDKSGKLTADSPSKLLIE